MTVSLPNDSFVSMHIPNETVILNAFPKQNNSLFLKTEIKGATIFYTGFKKSEVLALEIIAYTSALLVTLFGNAHYPINTLNNSIYFSQSLLR